MTPAAGLVFRLNERGYYALLISHSFGHAKVHYKLVKKDLSSTVTRDLLFWDEEWRPGSGRNPSAQAWSGLPRQPDPVARRRSSK